MLDSVKEFNNCAAYYRFLQDLYSLDYIFILLFLYFLDYIPGFCVSRPVYLMIDLVSDFI